jgi:hypothetical protein
MKNGRANRLIGHEGFSELPTEQQQVPPFAEQCNVNDRFRVVAVKSSAQYSQMFTANTNLLVDMHNSSASPL